MSALHLTLTVATYPEGDRWTWSLHSGRHIVSSSGSQLFSRRVDCAKGAEVGAGLTEVREALQGVRGPGDVFRPAWREIKGVDSVAVPITILDERAASEPTA